MLDNTVLFGLIGALLVGGFLANRGYRKTRIPDSLLLMAAGIVIGPVLGLIDPQGLRAFSERLGTFALILILFEGGLELNVREDRSHALNGLLLAVVGFVLTAALVVLCCVTLLGFDITSALLVGAVFGSSSSTMVMPILQQMGTRAGLRSTLLVESAFGDVLAVLVVGTIIGLDVGDLDLPGLLSGILGKLLISVLLAGAATLVWKFWTKRTAPGKFESVLLLGLILSDYALSRILGGSGLLSVLFFGIGIGNFVAENTDITSYNFHSDLTFFIRSFFFVVLGITVKFVSLSYIVPTVAILAAILIARIVALRVLGAAVSDWTPEDIRDAFWLLPRGLVTAVLAYEVFDARGDVFYVLPAIAFTIILATNLIVLFGTLPKGRAGAQPAEAIP